MILILLWRNKLELWCKVFRFNHQYISKGITNPNGETVFVEISENESGFLHVFPFIYTTMDEVDMDFIGYMKKSVYLPHY